MHLYVRIVITTKSFRIEKKRTPPRRSCLGMDMYLRAKYQGVSLGNGVDIKFRFEKHVYFM